MRKGWLVFTDLDGTLLDHQSYDHTPALPALKRLRDEGVPVIPVSGKTLAELKEIRARLNLKGPAIAENGTVIAYPGEQPQIAPPGYHMLRDFLIDRRADPRFNTLGFGDMSLEEIMELTGLPREDAKRAMKRYASEPFLWRGESENLAAFRKQVAEANLRLMEGSRYMYLLGDTDKATAVRLVIKHLQKIGKTITRIIALGDSDNDREMLLMATNPVIIRHADGSHLSLAERPDAMLSEEPGPEGWNRVMLRLLAEFEGGSFTDERPT